MNGPNEKLERIEQALWQVPAAAAPQVFQPPIEVWQSNVMRAIRLAADRGEQEWEVPWLALRRAVNLMVLVSALGWLAVWLWIPAGDTMLAQAAWLGNTDVVSSETWNLE